MKDTSSNGPLRAQSKAVMLSILRRDVRVRGRRYDGISGKDMCMLTHKRGGTAGNLQSDYSPPAEFRKGLCRGFYVTQKRRASE